MLTRVVGFTLLSALCSCVGMAFAAGSSASHSSAPDPKEFIVLATQAGMTEVELGELAMKNSQSPQIRKFAQRMVDDHGKANTELEGIAEQKNLIVGKKLDPEHSALVADMTGQSGAEFDTAYAKAMVDSHHKAVDLFTRESKGKDPELSAFAKKTLPTLQQHLSMAEQLNTSGMRPTSNK